MCLAVPARIVESEGSDAVVDLHGNRVAVNTLLVPEAQVGDWVLVHAGFAIQRLDCREAEETWAVLEDLAAAQERTAVQEESPDQQKVAGGERAGGGG